MKYFICKFTDNRNLVFKTDSLTELIKWCIENKVEL